MKSSAKRDGRPAKSRLRYLAAKASLEAGRFLEVVASNKNPSQRLSEFFKIAAEEHDVISTSFKEALLNFAKQLDPDKEWDLSNFSLEDPEVRALYALESMRLSSDVSDWPVVEAFRKAGLDDKNPLNWRMLLMFFCWSHFPPKRTVGTSISWTTEKYCQLLQEFHKLKPKRQTKRWEKAASEKLQRKEIFKKKNKPLSGGALRRALLDARKPEHNYALSRLIDENKRFLKEDHGRRGHGWPPVHFEDTLARFHRVEYALRDKDAPVDPANTGSTYGGIGFDGKDNNARLDLLHELRKRDHDGLLKELLAAGAQAYEFLVKLLDNRRANDHDALRNALIDVNDYDSFLKVVENVIAADHQTLFETVIDNAFKAGRGDTSAAVVLAVDTFSKAGFAHDTKRDEAISNALSEFYCEQLAVGNISLSQAMARAGMISRADLLGVPTTQPRDRTTVGES